MNWTARALVGGRRARRAWVGRGDARHPAGLAGAVWVALLVGCSGGPVSEGPPPTPALFVADALARAALARQELVVTGRLVLPDGAPAAGATVEVGTAEPGTAEPGTPSSRVDAEGRFRLVTDRHNAWLTASGPGLRTTRFGAWLAQPAAVDAVDLGALTVVQEGAEQRLLFGGDTSFARRFLDPEERTDRYTFPPDDPNALVLVSDPAPGSIDVVSRIAPLFDVVDFPVLNLETPVTEVPATPHPTKDYCYFTLPGSLEALARLGVSFVSIGNNHIYDYQARGIVDTRAALDAHGIAYSGAGATPEEAFAPWRASLGGLAFSFLGASSVSGAEHPIHYNASSTQGGAADLNDDARVAAAIGGERAAGRLPIVQVHTGIEYSVAPSDYTRTRLDLAAESGALLVVGHHPHVPQGFGVHAGVMQLFSLGNLAFDQDRQETMLGAIAVVDLDAEREHEVAIYPVYLEDYRPRLAVGPPADAVLRRLAELSDDTVEFALEPGRLLVFRAGERTSVPAERSVTLEVKLGADGVGVLDLRSALAPGESLLSVLAADGASRVRGGRDLLLYGTFEDEDVDEDFGEAARYDVTSAYNDVCLSMARRGMQGLCLVRSSTNVAPAVVAFRNRVRVWGDATNTPNRELTFVGYARGEGAGPLTVRMGYYASEGPAEFGDEQVAQLPGGTYDWTMFAGELHVPPDITSLDDPTANPRAMRFFLEHRAPASGEGVAAFDDLAIVSWDGALTPGAPLRTPNAQDFLRVEGAPGATLSMTLALRAGR